MNQLKQSTQFTVNIVAKLLPFIIQIALIALTILWLNQSAASASIEVPNGDYSDPCADVPYAKIVEPAAAEDPCADASDDVLKFVEPSDSYEECEEVSQLVSFEVPDAEAEPCADASEQFAKFAEPSYSLDECEEAPQLVSFEVPDAEVEPCADASEQFAKFVEPSPSEQECVESPSGLSLIHFEFPNDLGDDCQSASSISGESA
jgi:hypothetical protein